MNRTVKHFSSTDFFKPTDQFLSRHVGSQGAEKQQMLEVLGFNTLDELIASTVPQSIRLQKPLALDEPLSESEALNKLKSIMSKNKVNKSFIGMGYYETLLPGVIQRNVNKYILIFFLSFLTLLSLSNLFLMCSYDLRYLKTLVGILLILHIKLKLLKVVYNLY